MGVTGLIPFVKETCIDLVHLKDLSDSVAVIDTYCWLHRALVARAGDVYNGLTVTTHVDFCMRKVEEMKKYNIRPIFVFDGRNLPAKAEVEKARKASRTKAREEIDRLFAKGDNKGAYKILPRVIDVSQDMARQLIDKLIEHEIDYIVAPYEADAQISYLIRNGFAHFAISEDSDLILYGCHYVLYKLSNENTGLLFRMDRALECLGEDAYKFDFVKFRRMCILSGCDYLANLTGIGLMKSKKFFAKITNNDNIEKDLEKIPTILNMKKLEVTKEYIAKFLEAENVFNHQLVFCPRTRKLRPFTDYNENHVKEQLKYAGEYCDDELALNLACGNVCFKTLKIFDKDWMEKIRTKFFDSPKSIWNESYTLDEPKRFQAIIRQLEPSYEIPEELMILPVKRRFVEDDMSSQIDKMSVEEKKAKKSKSSVSNKETPKSNKKQKIVEIEIENEEDEEETFIGNSQKSNTSVSSVKSQEPSKKVEVKSRFFADQNTKSVEDSDGEMSEIEKILAKRQKIRESLKKLYSSTNTSSQDSGFESQQSAGDCIN